jgi:hypothetical protein
MPLIQVATHDAARAGNEYIDEWLAGERTLDTAKRILLSLCMLLGALIADASALTIHTYFIGGTAPANAVGKGNLDDIVSAAAHIWETEYSDPCTMNLYYGWAQLGHAGIHFTLEQDSLGREISGLVLFDNSDSTAFYLDATPLLNEEYQSSKEEFQELGTGLVNVARVFTNARGEAAGHIDLLSAVLHEIGHALGLSSANPFFQALSSSGSIDISGTIVPLANNDSGVAPHFDATKIGYGSLMSGLNGDERRLPSDLDIMVNAHVSGFSLRRFSLAKSTR